MAPKASYIRSCEKKNKMIFTVGLLPPLAYPKARAEMQALALPLDMGGNRFPYLDMSFR